MFKNFLLQYRFSIRHILVYVVLMSVMVLVMYSGFFTALNSRLSDYAFISDGNRSQDVVIVAIDDRSFNNKIVGDNGVLAWQKKNYARLVTNLRAAGAKTIGFDIIFSQDTIQADKQALIDVFNVLADVVIASGTNGGRYELTPLPDFQNTKAQVASVLFTPDDDGVLRQIQLLDNNAKIKFTLALALFNQFRNVKNIGISSDFITININDKQMKIPIYKNRTIINYARGARDFPTVSLVDAYYNRWIDKYTGEAVDVRDKVVLVGEMGSGLHDDIFTALDHRYETPGVILHANVVEQLVHNTSINAFTDNELIGILFVVGALLIVIFMNLSLVVGFVVVIFTLSMLYVGGIMSLYYGFLVHILYWFVLVIGAYVFTIVFRYWYNYQDGDFIKSAFSHYLSEHQIKKIVDNPHQLDLGGEMKDLTILFSDIVGFTAIMEQMPVVQVSDFLNLYLGEMTDIILAHQGTLDKYEGDAIMAFWNAPLLDEKHVVHAVETALVQQQRLQGLSQKMAQEFGIKDFRVRIGINTGRALVGNFGSKNRFDYTAMGDAVNMASRLESVNKFYGTNIMISEGVMQIVSDKYVTRKIDRIKIKGRKKPTLIYELLGQIDDVDKSLVDIKQEYEQALELYFQQEFKRAKLVLRPSIKKYKDEAAVELYTRCTYYLKYPPMANWDGSFQMIIK